MKCSTSNKASGNIDGSLNDNEKGHPRGCPFFVRFWLAKTAQKKQPISQLLFCRSGPTRTGDRLHPMQEC